jgi:hypothetical protein
MSINNILRYSHCGESTVTFTTSASTTGGFGLQTYAGGMILVDSATAGATLTFYTKTSETSATSYQIYDGGAAVSVSIGAGWAVPLPDALYGAAYVTAVVSTGTATCRIIVKG